MPYQNGTGPEGTGPTGRRMGPCGDGEAQNNEFTYGAGRGRGSRGRARGRHFHAGMRGRSRVRSDADTLQAEKTWLEKRLNLVNEALKKTSED